MGLIINAKIKRTKIFNMNEYDTVAAYGEKSAVKFYKKEFDAEEDMIDFPLKQELLTDLMYVEVDEKTKDATNVGGMWFVKRTFAEVLKVYFETGAELPTLIASTEF